MRRGPSSSTLEFFKSFLQKVLFSPWHGKPRKSYCCCCGWVYNNISGIKKGFSHLDGRNDKNEKEKNEILKHVEKKKIQIPTLGKVRLKMMLCDV